MEKAKKKQGKLSFRAVLILSALLPLLAATIGAIISAYVSATDITTDMIRSQLRTSVSVLNERLQDMAKGQGGSFHVQDGELYLGLTRIPEDDPMVEGGLDEDVHFTIFYGDTRYVTSIKDASGKRVVGTQATDKVKQTVLTGGQEMFIPHVEIVGQDFSGYYIPLKDKSGTICGMVFAGRPYKDTQAEINKMMLVQIIVEVIVAALFIVIVLLVGNVIVKKVGLMQKSIEKLEGGDFVTEVDNSQNIKDFARVCISLENMRKKLQETLLRVRQGAIDVNDGSNKSRDQIVSSQGTTAGITQAVSDLANGATSMAQDVQNTSDLAIGIGNSVEAVLEAANTNLEKGRNLYEKAKSVQKELEKLKEADEMTDTMAGEVQGSVNETAVVVEDISKAAEAIIGIASQTNLLALNASIEAARAGEAGKGFAVVADNIKGLAEESDQAAKEITGMLDKITALSNRNKELTGKIKEDTSSESVEMAAMDEAFEEMLSILQETEEGNQEIVRLVGMVNTAKDDIMNAVESLSSVSEENAASTQETSASLTMLDENMENVVEEASSLSEIANSLQETVDFFKV
jgi:methyl-accepting chemotaxis protein